MVMNTEEEKRRFVRLNALVDVVYKKKPPLTVQKLSLAKNISQGGICMIAYEELKESDFLDLQICLPEDKTPINAVGRVVWIKGFVIGDASTGKRFDVGVEFLEISDKDIARVNKYVFKHLPPVNKA